MTDRRLPTIVLALAAFAWSSSANAQQGATVGGVIAAISIESNTQVAVAGAVGYRVNRALGFGLEVTSISTLKPDASRSNGLTLGIDAVPTSAVTGTDGRSTIFTTNVRLEIPALTARVIPYVVAGGGVANRKETFTIALPPPTGIPVVVPPQSVTRSSTDVALTAGGGVSVLVADHASIDVDLRYVRLIADRDENVGRFGVGVTFRF